MQKKKQLFTLLAIACSLWSNAQSGREITPNDFTGSDTQRIEAAIGAARETTAKVVVIPKENSNGTGCWIIERAILLPSNTTLILDNCTVQLSDSCRDNMFRSDNVGIGILQPEWNHHIHIIGIGDVHLKGADNPRSTGDAYRSLTLTPETETNWRVSYGSDAGIHHVYVDGVITKARPDTPPPYGGTPYTLLVGGKGYGDPSGKEKIHHIHAMNLMGDGKSLILVEAPIANCTFMNGIYTGVAPAAITYTIDKEQTRNINEINLVKVTTD